MPRKIPAFGIISKKFKAPINKYGQVLKLKDSNNERIDNKT
jgi:hypothetical protein